MALTIEDLQTRLLQYEQNGAAKLYYSLNRKANEMADLLNRHNLANMVLDDPKDKTFDRLKVIWNDDFVQKKLKAAQEEAEDYASNLQSQIENL